jgi:hypothetical protein
VRPVAELHICVAALNRFTALGAPVMGALVMGARRASVWETKRLVFQRGSSTAPVRTLGIREPGRYEVGASAGFARVARLRASAAASTPPSLMGSVWAKSLLTRPLLTRSPAPQPQPMTLSALA